MKTKRKSVRRCRICKERWAKWKEEREPFHVWTEEPIA